MGLFVSFHIYSLIPYTGCRTGGKLMRLIAIQLKRLLCASPKNNWWDARQLAAVRRLKSKAAVRCLFLSLLATWPSVGQFFPPVDLTDTSRLRLMPQVQLRWGAKRMPASFTPVPAGIKRPPPDEVNVDGYQYIFDCGCMLAALSSLATVYLSDNAAQQPWYPVELLDRTELSFNPYYFSEYFTYGRIGITPKLYWGFSVIGPCGMLPKPWALARVASPTIVPGPVPFVGPSGMRIKWKQEGGAMGLSDQAKRIINRRLSNNEPTLAVRRTLDDKGKAVGYHAQIIAGWDSINREYLILDPARPLLDPATRRFIPTRATYGSAADYAGWSKNVEAIGEVFTASSLDVSLYFEDDPAPIAFAVTDPAGRRSGYNPVTRGQDDQSPNAYEWALGTEQPLTGVPVEPTFGRGLEVFNPESGTYRFEVHGTGTGPYRFRIGTFSGFTDSENRTVTGNITLGEVKKFEVAYSGTPVLNVSEVGNFTPQAIAGEEINAGIGQPVDLNGSRSFDADGQITSWDWDFGDGSSGSGAIVRHAYAAAGDFVVKLMVRDDAGISSSSVTKVRVRNLTPIANISGPYLAFGRDPNVEVRFNASASQDPRGGVLTATWDFGDNTPPLVTTDMRPTHRYGGSIESPTVYKVTVVMSNGIENSLPVTTTVTRLPLPFWETGGPLPTKNTFNNQPCMNPGETYQYAGVATPRTGSVWYGDRVTSWNLADGPAPGGQAILFDPFGPNVTVNTKAPDYKFTTSFQVPLSASQGLTGGGRTNDLRFGGFWVGGPDVQCPYVPTNRLPVGIAGGPYTGVVGQPVQVDGSASYDPDGDALTYSWAFGDDSTGSGVKPSHAYSAPGTYVVSVAVSDGKTTPDPIPGKGYARVVINAVGDTTPPVITPTITGTLGANGWYRSAVAVSWTVSDPESGVTNTTGCTGVTLSSNTAGITLTCVATNAVQLTSSRSVNIKIDQTQPVISGAPVSGCILWPPNHSLISVATLTATDPMSGVTNFNVVATSNEPDNGLGDGDTPSDIAISGTGLQARSVQLRAERSGTGNGRVYLVTGNATDAAGNVATVQFQCTVPINLSAQP